jgi:hypothetical protein
MISGIIHVFIVTKHSRASFANNKAASDAYLKLQVATNNQAYVNSKVPIAFDLKCIIDSDFGDNDAEYSRWINSASELSEREKEGERERE